MDNDDLPHRRSPKVSKINISHIVVEKELELDDQFTKLQIGLAKGQISVGLTRISTEEITSGFYKRTNGDSILVTNLDQSYVEFIANTIRAGHRPNIEVYWNSLHRGKVKWVCPDSEVSLAAYKKLGIAFVPCRILKPKKFPLAEASIWMVGQGGVATYDRAVGPNIETFASIIEDEKAPTDMQLHYLHEHCERTLKRIIKFHSAANDAPHYHQMLYALVSRHARAIDTISRLIEIKRPEHAAAIVRLAYEAFLNFYIDWLSPTFFGPRLQLLSAIQTNSEIDIDKYRSQLGGFERLLENAARKADISPLGPLFHKIAYPPLSSIMHQTYGNLEGEAITFPGKGMPPLDDELERSLVRWIDYITSALLVRANNEIGVTL